MPAASFFSRWGLRKRSSTEWQNHGLGWKHEESQAHLAPARRKNGAGQQARRKIIGPGLCHIFSLQGQGLQKACQSDVDWHQLRRMVCESVSFDTGPNQQDRELLFIAAVMAVVSKQGQSRNLSTLPPWRLKLAHHVISVD